MLFLYNLGIRIYYLLIVVYQHFNTKAHLWLQGRKNLFEKIANEVDHNSPSIWFHFASLGEFEQGRPVLERAKESYPTHKIVVTFFSPSGYELRKNFNKADHIFYLPLDTNKNAERFVKLVNPSLVIFTKYEFWFHFFNQLHQKNTPLIVISAIFRPSQVFFKWYGNSQRKMLRMVNHFFVQNEESKLLLSKIELLNVSVSGDTRFDRVLQNADAPRVLPEVKRFCDGANIFIAGSTWPDDERLIGELIASCPDWKFIIAPHEIREDKLKTLIATIGKSSVVRHSTLNSHQTNAEKSAQVLIIDNVGMLSSIYQYGHISYIGGGFGVGIHNTLEAAAFGLPVIFGPNYTKFIEAKALVKLGAGFSIKDAKELLTVVKNLQSEQRRVDAGTAAKNYVQQERGATDIIMNHIDRYLKQ